MGTKLPLHEWLIILLFCSLLLGLTAIALIKPKPVFDSISSRNEKIIPSDVMQIKVEGYVAKPGFYQLPYQTTLKKLLEMVEPASSADLSELNYRKKLRDGQTIIIPERKIITIQVTGAVQEPGALKILSGTRCCDLADQLKLLPEADIKALKRKNRFVKGGDMIEVQFQKQVRAKKKSKS